MSRNEVSGDKVLTKMLGIVFIIRSESQAYNKVVSIKSKSKYNPNKSKDNPNKSKDNPNKSKDKIIR